MSIRSAAISALAACLTASCSATSTPPPAAKATTYAPPAAVASKVVPPPTETSPLAKDWKSYGGTAPTLAAPKNSPPANPRSRTSARKYSIRKPGNSRHAGMPMIPAGENVTGAMCALSNTVDDMKVVYVITTVKPAQAPAPEVTKTTAYLFDLKSSQPLATKELQAADSRPEIDRHRTQWRLVRDPTVRRGVDQRLHRRACRG